MPPGGQGVKRQEMFMEGEQPTIQLDVNDFKEESTEVEGQTTESESSTDESKTDQPAEDAKDDSSNDDDAKADGQDADDNADDAATGDEDDKNDGDQDDQSKKGAARPVEVRKAELQNEIRQLVHRRNELREAVAAKNAEVYKPQTASELEADGMSPEMARIEALEQRTKMAEYNAYVTDLNASLNTESLQVMADFPVFDPASEAYDETLASRAKAIYEKVAQVKTDEKTGLIIAANVLPYEIYKAFAETAQSGAKQGEVKGQRAAEKMLAAADPTPSGGDATKKAKPDPFLAGLTKGLNL